jgi:uncharacterized membrane protein
LRSSEPDPLTHGPTRPDESCDFDPASLSALETNETGRIEAFSDGVFAIAATLLVFSLRVPDPGGLASGSALWHHLAHDWPSYAAFVISFLSILIMWSSHHNIFMLIRRVDHDFLLLNGLVLLGIAATPFSTQLLATHFGHPGARAAALVYSAVFLFISGSYNAMWRYASHGRRLLAETTTAEQVRSVTRQYAVGPIAFALALALSFLSAAASLLVFVAVEVFFALPAGANRRSGGSPRT